MRLIGAVSILAMLVAGGCSSLPSDTLPVAQENLFDAAKCATIAPVALGAESASGRWIAADAKESTPAFCEVSATLNPAAGSHIGVVYRLPARWNGRLLGLGGGGWAGNVTLVAAKEGLNAGYATAQTDGGHAATSPWDNSWASEPEAVTDFAHRAIHQMTVAGKRLVAVYYGRAHERAYFQGCSTGGRMALMEAQRYPEDYDAITAGAPVYTLQVQTSAVLRDNAFAPPGAGFTSELLDLVTRTVVKACDANDGLEDGVIGDPRACGWDPGSLVCKPGDAAGTCISEPQAQALRDVYRGIRAPDGQWASFPLSKGGESGWSFFVATDGGPIDAAKSGGLITLDKQLWPGRTIDWRKFDPGRDVTEARTGAFAQAYEAKDPDLSRFIARGGKLILWHGENDQGPSVLGTALYYDQVLGRVPEAGAHVRFFALPGVPHCRGGPGADTLDLLAALDEWTATSQAPDSLVVKGNGKTRRACAWPKMARYDGSGDSDDPANWQCVSRPS